MFVFWSNFLVLIIKLETFNNGQIETDLILNLNGW